MRRIAALALLPLVAAAQAPAPAKPKTPSEIVAGAPRSDWREIAAEDLLVFELKDGKKVVMQLAPEFAPVHVAN
ncbi:MAG TPA: peptidylprolyl isomerase, partial [Sphingomicrobium sp.]|nr:peptidylprolyl isomerase [Sphingomicrobium sp.]